MATGGGPREAIQTLSFILTELDMPKVPSEVFRQAKFDHPSSYSSMMQVLYRLVLILNVTSSISATSKQPYFSCVPSVEQIISSVPEEVPNDDWMLLIIQNFLLRSRYSRLSFYSMCNNSSRELLLGLGWILFGCGLIDQIKTCVIRSASSPLFPFKMSIEGLLSNIDQECTDIGSQLKEISESLQHNNINDSILQKLIFTNSRLSRQLVILERSIGTYKKLRSQILSLAEGNVELYEIYVMTHPEFNSECISNLEKHLSLLTLLVQWETLEPVFTKWLESVLDLHQREQLSNIPQIATVDTLKSKVDELQSSIEDFIRKNKNYIENVDKITLPSSHKLHRGAVLKDPLVLALEGIASPPLIDVEVLETRLSHSVDSVMYRADQTPDLDKLKQELKTKRVHVLKKVQCMQETIPNSINIMFTRALK